MPDQTVFGQVLQLKLSKVVHDRLAVLFIYIDVLTLDLCCLLARDVCGGVKHCEVGEDHSVVDHVRMADVHSGGLQSALTQVTPLVIRVVVPVLLKACVYHLRTIDSRIIVVLNTLHLFAHLLNRNTFHLVLRIVESGAWTDHVSIEHDGIGGAGVL